MTFPSFLRDYLSDQVLHPEKAAYAEMDSGGILLSSGGSTELFGPVEIREGAPVQESLPFLEGLLPFDGEPLVLERVAATARIHVDAHLFPIPAGCCLLLLDVSEVVSREEALLQRANELSLLKRNPGLLGPELKDLFRALDLLAVEEDDRKRFRPIGRLPDWAGRFVPLLDHPEEDWREDPLLAFLGEFMGEAKEFWEERRFGTLKSGLWLHSDPDGPEFAFQATAAFTGSRRVLLVDRNPSASLDTQLLLQRGRDLALDHHDLAREWKKLSEARQQLEGRVRDRTRELEESNRRLATALRRRTELEEEQSAIIQQVQQSQRIEALGTLAGGIAHDFNNILAAIVGYSETGLEEIQRAGEVHHSFSAILEAAGRARDLVRQILVMSRRADTETETIRMRDVVEEVVRLMRATLPGTIRILSDFRTAAVVVANATQLHQVVTNLCTNAGQAMQRSGGTLELVLGEVILGEGDLEANPELSPGAFAVLEVRDTGPGIPDVILPRIFDPFFTSKGPGGGTGIGLSVVHGVVSSANGTVTVETEMGKGTTFRVFWPLSEESETQAERVEPQPNRGTESILFVDDEPMQVELARRMLGRIGYRVLAFTDAREALRSFTADPLSFDLMITDQTMPQMTGEALSREVLKARPDFPVMVYSGHVEPEVESAALRAGVRRFLRKPIRWRQMGEAIREVLDGEVPPKSGG